MVYVPLADGTLYALEAGSGAEQWSFNPAIEAQDIYSPTADPVIADGVVYFMTSGPNLVGELIAIDIATQQARWRYETPTENYSAPSVAGELLIWGGLDGRIHALTAASGDPAWTFPTSDIIFSAPAIAGDIAYVGSNDKYLYALDTATGRMQWQFRADSGVSSPVIADGVVYVGTEGGVLYALE